MKRLLFIGFIFVFPIIIPELDDRMIACFETGVKEGGLNDFIHQLPPTYTLDRESGHVVFGDGERGRIPPTSKHSETDGQIVFADGDHSIHLSLCGNEIKPQ